MKPLGWRIALVLVAAGQAAIGLWGVLAPHSFFNEFPGLGHHWVAPLGPYNEHLVRDYAASELGFAVLLASAGIWWERRLVLVAGAAFLAATLPHFAYHLTTTDSLSTTDNGLSLGLFALEIAVVGGAMGSAYAQPSERPTAVQSADGRPGLDSTPSHKRPKVL
jgi:hypothetical protein